MPFEKGKSGNEATMFSAERQPEKQGRPKGALSSSTRLLRWLELEVETENPETGEMERSTLLEKMDAQIIKKALMGDIAAYREILDRVEGKPMQRNEHSLNPEGLEGFSVTVNRKK